MGGRERETEVKTLIPWRTSKYDAELSCVGNARNHRGRLYRGLRPLGFSSREVKVLPWIIGAIVWQAVKGGGKK